MIIRYCAPLAAILMCAVSRASDQDVTMASVPVEAIVLSDTNRMSLNDRKLGYKLHARLKETSQESKNYDNLNGWCKKMKALMCKEELLPDDFEWLGRNHMRMKKMVDRNFLVAPANETRAKAIARIQKRRDKTKKGAASLTSARNYAGYQRSKHFAYAALNRQIQQQLSNVS